MGDRLRGVILLLTVVTAVCAIIGNVVRKFAFGNASPEELNKKKSYRIFIAVLMLIWGGTFIYSLIALRTVLNI